MGRAAQHKPSFTFVKGLQSEANPLTFPEGASDAEENFVLLRNGSRKRRLGIDYESGWSDSLPFTALTDAQVKNWVVSTFVWKAVGGNGDKNHLIVQVGPYIVVYDLINGSAISANRITTNFSKDGTGLGRNYLILSTDFPTSHASAQGDPPDFVGREHVAVSFGKGKAFFTSKNTEPFFMEYHSDTGAYSVHALTLNVRDFDGIDDTLAVDTRPAAANLTALQTNNKEHYYNLRNQGWTDANITTYITGTGTAPSRADIMYLGKDSTDTFTAAWLNKQVFGTTHAPKGTFLYNPFNILRSNVLSTLTAYDQVENFRPTVTAFFAGRVWYAGVESDRLSGTLFFSKILEDVKQDANKHHQVNDPTSEHFNEVLANDGGTIELPEAGTVTNLVSVGSGLLVFAAGGVWHVTGGDSGFSATNFVVRKITNVGTLYFQSVVNAEGYPMFWSSSGIYMIRPDEAGVNLVAQNLTQNTIQTQYLEWIEANNDIVGVYDEANKVVKWLFNPDSAEVVDEKFTHQLSFDLTLGAFSLDTIGTTAFTYPHIAHAFPDIELKTGDMVRYLVAIPNAVDDWTFTVGEFNDTTFTDWKTFDSTGVDYKSFVQTRHEIAGEAMRDKQLDLLFVHLEQTEKTATNGTLNNQSSCMMQAKFDFSNHADSNKETALVEAYKLLKPVVLTYSPTTPGTENFNYGHEIVTTRHKVRGSGKSIQLRFESSTGKDCRLLGWSMLVSGETIP